MDSKFNIFRIKTDKPLSTVNNLLRIHTRRSVTIHLISLLYDWLMGVLGNKFAVPTLVCLLMVDQIAVGIENDTIPNIISCQYLRKITGTISTVVLISFRYETLTLEPIPHLTES